MELKVTTPTATLDIVTDLDALRRSIELTNRIRQLEPPTDGPTEREAAAVLRERGELTDELCKTADQVKASTITLNLHGLRSNEWAQLSMRCQTTIQGRRGVDYQKLVTLATPRMLTGITDNDHRPVEADETTVIGLIDSLTDSQTAELLTTIQELNSPATSLPKETSTLLKSTNSPN